MYLGFTNGLGNENAGLYISGGCNSEGCLPAIVEVHMCSFSNNVAYGASLAKSAGVTVINTEWSTATIDLVTLYGCYFGQNVKVRS